MTASPRAYSNCATTGSVPVRSRPTSAAAAVLAAVVALFAAGCGGTDKASPGGAPAAREAQRIVPLNGDIAEIVFALGLGDDVVGTDTSATYPETAAAKPKIGYQRQLSAEGILSLRPTIAIGTAEAGPPEVIEQLRTAGVKVEIVPAPSTVDDIPQRIQAVADKLGVADSGRTLAEKTAGEIDAAKATIPAGATPPRVAFLYLRGATTAMLGGIGSRADALIRAAGAVDAGTEAGVQGYKPITPEALATAKPDVILLLDGGLASVGGVDGVLKLPGVAQTPAGAAKRIVALDDQYLLGMGPRSGSALRDLVAKLYAK
jgi:iron complex transport system substrate-binding protein